MMRTVAVDAMGGDHAPAPEVEGAVAAVRERLANVVLVGDEARLRKELARLEMSGAPGISIHHASDVITMDDHPGVAAKNKKDSSMRVAFELAKRGQVDAVVSAGNSGAMMACGLFVMKRLAGVDRPGVVTTFPTKTGVCALMDMGANVECRPQTLAQFAVQGAVYARVLHGKARPRVGVLSNGEEVSKGTDLTRGAHRLLAADGPKDFDYVGYVEGNHIFDGEIDVVVTDGFTGNVVLKTAEGVGQVIMSLLRDEIVRSRMGKVGALLLKNAFRRFKKKVEYDEAGGAPLVGVDGVAVLCHGRSNAKAIKNGVRVAASFAEAALPREIAAAIAKHAALWASEVVQASGS
jgi:glycerol-3-phosphate acyltransferase PlsX